MKQPHSQEPKFTRSTLLTGSSRPHRAKDLPELHAILWRQRVVAEQHHCVGLRGVVGCHAAVGLRPMSQAGALPVASDVQGHSSALRFEAQPLPCTASTAKLLGSDDGSTKYRDASATQAFL